MNMNEFNTIIELQKLVDKYKYKSQSLEKELTSYKIYKNKLEKVNTKLIYLINKQDNKIENYKKTLLILGAQDISNSDSDSDSELEKDSDEDIFS